MSAPRYDRYRDSAVEWLGPVPAHWTDTRLRYAARLNPSKSEVAHRSRDEEVSFLPMEAIGEDGSLRLDQTRTLGDVETGYTFFRNGDVAVAKITPCFENGKGAIMRGLVGGVGFGTTELIVARPLSNNLPDFLAWLFSSTAFRKLGEGAMYGAGGQKRVPDDFVRDFPLALPPPAEQAAIAAFLDRETGKIDALVEAQTRLIELLKEKRQAAISHAVTKGLDPAAPMKDSGVEWLGQVPAHWEVVPIRSLFRFVKRQDGDELDVLSVYRDYGVISKASRNDNNNVTPEDLSKYQTVRPGDLVVNKMKAWQGSLGISPLAGITSPDYAVFEPTHSGSADYLHLLLRSQLLPDVYRLISNGIRLAQWRLEPDKFKELRVPWPPVAEQQTIGVKLAEDAARMGLLESEASRGIALLHEHRAALISAAVTGKIDVRGFAPQRAEAA